MIRFRKPAFRQVIFLLALLSLLLGAALGSIAIADPEPAVKNLVVSGVRLGQNSGVTRFVIDLNQDSPYQIVTMANPYRVAITMPSLRWQILPGTGTASRGVIRNFRYGSFENDSFRVVLDLQGPVQIRQAGVLPPITVQNNKLYRLMVDLAPVDERDFRPQQIGTYQVPKAVAASKPTPEIPAAKPAPNSKPKQSAQMHTLVLDAGHGGVDPGAIGIKKTYEKNITLAVAKDLKNILEATGHYKVILTRDNDEFIKLYDRVKIARKAKADLFISLHADHHSDKNVSGASVYTLSEKASDTESARLAEQENKADIIAGVDLKDEDSAISSILINLAQQETMNHSIYFSRMLIGELQKNVAIIDYPLRSAGFVVLKAPDIPSVLIEMGFLSNAHDEQLLKDSKYRAKLARAIAESIDSYFNKVPQSAL
ncbi:MAG: N-acetylmuramoyl-L-alanine amidase [Alphaproteobacteria bacterium]|nr:MAG: N-acetylmuramoyl-L-alanine amidase [Alphaproteobacteria bacterium]